MIDTKRTEADERGVSPVIGVILMVAITVILAAVIGSFVLGIGGDVEAAPQASLTLDSGNSEIVHQGGDSIYNNETTIKGTTLDGVATDAVLEPGGTWSINTPSDDTVRVVDDSSGQIIAKMDV